MRGGVPAASSKVAILSRCKTSSSSIEAISLIKTWANSRPFSAVLLAKTPERPDTAGGVMAACPTVIPPVGAPGGRRGGAIGRSDGPGQPGPRANDLVKKTMEYLVPL